MTSDMIKTPTRPRHVKRSITLPKTRARICPFPQNLGRPDRACSAAKSIQQDGGEEGYEKVLGSGCDYTPEKDDDFLPMHHIEIPILSKNAKVKYDNISDEDANARSTGAQWGSQQLRRSNDSGSPPTKQDLDELAQGAHRLASGFEIFTFAGTKNRASNTYLGTQGARQDKDHVSACQSSPSNIIVTFKDDEISASLRKPQSSADTVTTALYQRSLSSLYRSRGIDPKIQLGLALRDPVNFNHLAKELFPTVKRTVTVHLFDILPAIPSDERQALLIKRREQLSKMLLQFDKCSTLVISCENYDILKYSGIVDYLVESPKRPDLELEIRIGIWTLPVQTPKARLARHGISSVLIAEKCRKDLEGASINDDAGRVCKFENTRRALADKEMMRVDLLESLSEALGPGLVVPYGSPDGCFSTAMWVKEAWVWGREKVAVT